MNVQGVDGGGKFGYTAPTGAGTPEGELEGPIPAIMGLVFEPHHDVAIHHVGDDHVGDLAADPKFDGGPLWLGRWRSRLGVGDFTDLNGHSGNVDAAGVGTAVSGAKGGEPVIELFQTCPANP